MLRFQTSYLRGNFVFKLIDLILFYIFSFTRDYFTSAIREIEELISQGRLQEGQYKFLTFMLSLPDVSEEDTLITMFSMFNDSLPTVRIIPPF